MPKLDQQEFDALISRVRAGDPEAAEQFVRLYEPEIRRDIRIRLTDPRLRRTLDSMDICQSVFGNFFVCATMGQIDFDRPGQLLRLLSTMARNKVIDRHRREKARRPKHSGDERNGHALADIDIPDPNDSPSQIIAGRELIELIEGRLSPEERETAKLRRQGKSWNDIGNELNNSGEALRKRLSRSCQRILEELGIEDTSDENASEAPGRHDQ